ncbi:dicarboxylate transporter/tellurite-resistance protein TehA (plasmid) [Roseomonas sp. CCTCC AB2023176]|uniref:dicarboxylate transporter/tellurite-resistance protein TehA n=1 Tax=Roseomonas sp. CCTCC AB2023176 TaxID=3342640 RepID=UPI0035DFD28B
MPNLPASYFGIVLGLVGLGNAWRAAHGAWGWSALPGELLVLLGAGLWLALLTLFAAKWLIARAVAVREAADPVSGSFLGIPGVSGMLVGTALLPYDRTVSVALFALGLIYAVGFAVWQTGSLWQGGRDHAATTPILYLPTVAGSFVAAAGAAAFGWQDWGLLAFGAGLFSWLAIESVLVHRLYTSTPLPEVLRPVLGIQLAPPAVGSLALLAVAGEEARMVLHVMLGYALLQVLVMLRLLPWILRQPFAVSYWAFTFGLTALATVALRLSNGSSVVVTLAPVLFTLANIVVLVALVGTMRLLLAGRLLPILATQAR